MISLTFAIEEGANQSGASITFCYLRQAPCLTHKYYTRLEMLVREKCSSLFCLFVIYEEKEFYDRDTKWHWLKTICIRYWYSRQIS